MKIQIVSGFLGSGKTTFLNRYLTCLQGRVAVIENEFGPAGLDAQLLGDEVPVREISAGCICCSMAMNLQQGLAELEEKYHPEYLLIEPSGVGRLSDVVKACTAQDYVIDKLITMVDLSSYEDYSEAFGEFYLDQIRSANLLLPTCFQDLTEAQRKELLQKLHEQNPQALLYGEDWREMDRDALLDLVELSTSVIKNPPLSHAALPAHETFSSLAFEDIPNLSKDELEQRLIRLNSSDFGQVLRAKGFVQSQDGDWMHFDFTPKNLSITERNQETAGKVVLIGCGLNKERLHQLFR
jgi:G3E family GTPase